MQNLPDGTVNTASKNWSDVDANVVLLDVEHLGVASNGRRVTAITDALAQALSRYTVSRYTRAPLDSASLAVLLQFVVQGARDVAEDDEPKGTMYATEEFRSLDNRAVWLAPNGRGLTAMLLTDY